MHTIAIGSDHAGFNYKSQIVIELKSLGYTISDLGAYNEEPSDYPDFGEAVALAIKESKAEKGILICGSGAGVSMVVNKFNAVRGAVCHDTYSAHQAVEHDNMNVLCLGSRVIGYDLAREIIFTFLNASFSGESRHLKRLEKLEKIENKNMKD